MKKTLRKSIVMLLTLAMLLSTLGTLSFTASAAPIVTNGDFENGITGYVLEKGNYTNATATVSKDDYLNSNVVTVSTGDTAGGVNAFAFYQSVKVEKNTDYVWTFNADIVGGDNHYFGVVSGDTVSISANTTLPITAVSERLQGADPVIVRSNGKTYTSEADGYVYSPVASGVLNATAGGADPNWVFISPRFGQWDKITITFNSGDNDTVCLAYSARSSGRSISMDDWVLYEEPEVGQLINGDFEEGLVGFSIQKSNWTATTVEAVADPTNTRSGKVLSIDTGATYGSLHGFSVYQAVEVKANTDYVWEFWIQPTAQKNQYIGVVTGNTVNAWKNTTVPITATLLSGTLAFTANDIPAGAQAKLDGSADPNWLAFEANWTWKKVRIDFNSGDNTALCLAYGARASGRAVLFDDWKLYEKPEVGVIRNGDFENGLEGFDKDQWIDPVQVIDDPDIAGNHILEVGGTAGGNYWQDVAVEPNTDYIWTFRSKRVVGTNATVLSVTPTGSTTNLINAFTHNGGGFTNLWNGSYYFEAYNGAWVTFNVSFNSGDNTSVRLNHTAGTGDPSRKDYMDDWKLVKAGEITNGGFENGLDGFVATDKIVASITTEDVHSGNSAVALTGVATAFGNNIYKDVPVKPNTDYVWDFWYKSYDNSKVSNAAVMTVGGALIPSFVKSDEGYLIADRLSFVEGATNWHQGFSTNYWVKYSIYFNSGDNLSVRLAIDVINNLRSVVTDDWSLSEHSFVLGDADNDGTADAKDLVAITAELLTGKAKYYKSGADMDKSGKVDILDLIKIKKAIASSPIAGYQLVWADDFGGQELDSSKWLQAGHMNSTDNLEITYADHALDVTDGAAHLYAGRNPAGSEKPYYAGASVATANSVGSDVRMSFKYGYVEMRAKMNFANYAFTNFWMKSVKDAEGNHAEIDIFEQFSDRLGDGWIQSGIHQWREDNPDTAADESVHILHKAIDGAYVELNEDWHTYGLLWTPEKLEFKLDGVTYHTIDITGSAEYSDVKNGGTVTASNAPFHDYFYLIMYGGVNTELVTEDTVLPTEYEIDYVHLYQNADGEINFGN